MASKIRNNGNIGVYYADADAMCWLHTNRPAKNKIFRGDEIIQYCNMTDCEKGWECLPQCLSIDTCWHYEAFCMTCDTSLLHWNGNGFNRCWHYIHVMCNTCHQKRLELGECPQYSWESNPPSLIIGGNETCTCTICPVHAQQDTVSEP